MSDHLYGCVMQSTSTQKPYYSESVNSFDNVNDRLCVKARFMGAMDELNPSDNPDGLPEVHVAVDSERHDFLEDCWCEPTLEYKTEFCRVYRHRRIN